MGNVVMTIDQRCKIQRGKHWQTFSIQAKIHQSRFTSFWGIVLIPVTVSTAFNNAQQRFTELCYRLNVSELILSAIR